MHITDFPKGATFNKGMLYNDIWIFMPEDFGDVILTLPKHFSGNYMLKALAIDPTNNISRSGISILSVLPAADQPYLNVLDTCYDPGDGNIFTLHIESYPLDRSEKLVVFITGLPENYFLKNSSRAHNGSIQLDQFSDVLISFNGTFNQTTFDVVATSFVTVDGMAHSASINQSITIDYCSELTYILFGTDYTYLQIGVIYSLIFYLIMFIAIARHCIMTTKDSHYTGVYTL